MAGQTTLSFLDAYCERAGDAGLWAEPVNAATNLFFLFVAFLCWREFRRHELRSLRASGDIWLLILSLIGIGIGSGLWHTHATQATMLADVIPITVFINVYLLSAMRRLLGLRWAAVLFWWGLYWAFTVTMQRQLPPDTLNGTIMYVPTYITLALLTAAIVRKHLETGIEFVYILGIWTLSLVFRTVDLWVCPFFPLGTHFLWHTLNAYMLYRLVRVLLKKIH